MKLQSLITISILISGCAGFNPNPGERTTDMAWTSGKFTRAFEIAKPHAEAGKPWAQLRLAVFYENGWGVKKNIRTSRDWYIKAVQQKAEGKWATGLMVGATGKPGYFNQNSDALIAEFNLANLYYKGEGIPRNLVQSYIHVNNVIKESKGKSIFFCCEFARGRSFKQSQFISLRNKLKSEMTSKQLSKANSTINN